MMSAPKIVLAGESIEVLIYESERWTYANLQCRVRALAHLLHERGIRKGDRVAIGMRNYPEWVLSFWACQSIGAIAVTLNAWWTGDELNYAFEDSAARAAILDGERALRIAPYLAKLPLEIVLGVRDAVGSPHAEALDDALAAYLNRDRLPNVSVGPDDYSTIMYTSGTTGRPKGALATHRNHVTNLTNTFLGGAVAARLAGAPAQNQPADPPPQATTGPTTYVRPVRMARITSAVREGDSLAITIDNHDGTLKPLPYYGPDEVCAFDIRPRRLLFPDTLQQIADLEAFIEGHRDQAVGRVLGPADYAATTNYMMGGQSELRRRIPADPAAVRFMWQQYERVRGVHRYREVVNPEQSRALVTVFLKDADYVRTRRLMDDLREYERTHLAPHGISLTFAGDIAVS
ncbi:MAG: AMP-binding protein, partial [Proteobacteria bacterium]|nr:AMP-binding protein [Pseudomonadota bacterium]